MKWFKLFLFSVVLPTFLNIFVYFGFVTAYTTTTFTKEGFLGQYRNGIYRYRVLGRVLLLSVNRVLERHPVYHLPPDLLDWLGGTTESLYLSYFVLNTVFFCLTMGVLHRLFETKGPDMS